MVYYLNFSTLADLLQPHNASHARGFCNVLGALYFLKLEVRQTEHPYASGLLTGSLAECYAPLNVP
jgi:hypothetical protein